MANLKKPPIIHAIQQLQLPKYETWALDNGMPVYNINMGTQDVVRLEVVFRAGRPYEQHPLAARTTAAMLREGTRDITGGQLSEMLDFYGANLNIPFQVDTSNIILYSLGKHFEQILPAVASAIIQPAFPEKELHSYNQRKKQSIKEDLTKVDVVAYRQITANFFGEQHPYGYNSYPEMYDHIERQQLVFHHNNFYTASNGYIILSGKITEKTKSVLNQHLGVLPAGSPANFSPNQLPLRGSGEKKSHVKFENALQSAIRIGRPLFSRHHVDAHGMYVTSNILGGYFGSRLMKNIREDKGYSYNISASFDPMRFDGSFQIDTEVSHDTVSETLHEIYHEINCLRQDRITAEELSMVRNYLMGTFLSMVDGPFHWAETMRSFIGEGLPPETLSQMAETVLSITPQQIQDLAQQYLKEEDLWELVVGE